MNIIIKNLQEQHWALIIELARTLQFEISDLKEDQPYDSDFVAKIKQGEEDIKAGHTTKMTLDDIWK
ncbi:MAG: DUF2683 family protein [Janthinobacterium lividum]